MKRCSYCGCESEDDAEYCSGCGSRLTPTPAVTAEGGPARISSASKALHSENLWVAKDAWKALGMFVLFQFIAVEMWRGAAMVVPGFRQFSATGAGHFVFSSFQYPFQIAIVLYFARTDSWQPFLKAFGLTKGPSQYVWFGVAAALIIRTVGHLTVISHLSRGATTTSLRGFAHSTGMEQILYLAPALIAPFAEEMYMRGFFYRAFRGSYSVMVSTLLILGITMATHLDQVHRSWIAAVDIGALTIIQCFLRERTGNLWDCIICHLVFNATGAFLALRIN